MITDIDFNLVKVCGIEVKRNNFVSSGDWERFWQNKGQFLVPIGQDIIHYVDMDTVNICGTVINRPSTISCGNWFVFWVEKHEVGLKHRSWNLYG